MTLKACFWKEDTSIKEGGKCFDLHFRYEDYKKLNQEQLDPDIHIDKDDRFNIDGNSYDENIKYMFDPTAKPRDLIKD